MIDFEISKIPTKNINININVELSNDSLSHDIKDKIADWLTNKYNMIYNDINPEQIFMTNGSISALYLLITKYNIPGNKIIVDNPTNHKIIEIFEEYLKEEIL
jgi:DNA-binding transcriptional MocR family regulator